MLFDWWQTTTVMGLAEVVFCFEASGDGRMKDVADMPSCWVAAAAAAMALDSNLATRWRTV